LSGLAETCRAVIVNTYKKEGDKLVEHLKGHAISELPQYKHLDWRLEITVASKWSHDICAPSFSLRLDTTGSNDNQAQSSIASVHMTSDYAALKRVADSLDEAAAEMKGAHSKRIIRYIH
jgi:lysyl-tRNA synthetase class I